jgi:hypothetical protein
MKPIGDRVLVQALEEKELKKRGIIYICILPGNRPVERAAMFLAIIAGFQVMRQVVGISGLTKAEPSHLSDRLQALFEVLVKPDVD